MAFLRSRNLIYSRTHENLWMIYACFGLIRISHHLQNQLYSLLSYRLMMVDDFPVGQICGFESVAAFNNSAVLLMRIF